MRNYLLMFATYLVLNAHPLKACTDYFEDESDWSVATQIDDFDNFDDVVEQVKYYEKFSGLTIHKILDNTVVADDKEQELRVAISSFYSIAYRIEELITNSKFSYEIFVQIQNLFGLMDLYKNYADFHLSSNEFAHVEAISKDELYGQLESVKYFLLDKI